MTIGKVVFVAISARMAGVLWVTIISGSRVTSSAASLSMSPSRPPADIQSNTKFCPCIHPRSARTLVRVSCVRTPKMLLGGQGSTTKSLPTRRGCWATTCVADMGPKTRLAKDRTHALLMRRPERHLSQHLAESGIQQLPSTVEAILSGIPPLGKLKLIATILLEQQPLTQRSARPQPDYRIRTGTRPLSSSQAVSRGPLAVVHARRACELETNLGASARWNPFAASRRPDQTEARAHLQGSP